MTTTDKDLIRRTLQQIKDSGTRVSGDVNGEYADLIDESLEALERDRDGERDAARYRYVRDVAFQYGNVSLTGNDDDGTAFVIFEPKIYLPDLPNGLRYEEEDWDSGKIDAAIDAAMEAKC